MSRSLRLLVFVLGGLFASCSGCNEPNPDDGTTDDGPGVFIAPGGEQCAEATPCGNCDQDCRQFGNPFTGGGDSGGDGASSGGTGDGSGGGGDVIGTGPGGSAGGGGTGFDGDFCTVHSDCRGLCGGSGTCVGYGEGGYNGDSCQSAADCRGECNGDGLCIGSGIDPGWDTSGSGGATGGGTSGGTTGTGGGTGSDPGGTGGGTSGGGTSGGDPNPDGTGSGGSGSGYDQNVCVDLQINLDYAIPTIALLIDQSGSMTARFGGGMDRWEAEYYSLMDPDMGIVKQIEGAFRIGMSLYSSNNGGPSCPLLADVRPDLNNHAAIDRVFSQARPNDDTPTGASILGTLRQFDVHPDQGRKILLLSTDGEPDTCTVPDPQNGQGEAVAAAEAAYAQGIETIVLSVGDEVGREHLEDMANAGVGLPVGGAQQAPYYSANDPQQLATELQGIIDLARSCIFRVQGGIVDPGVLDQSTVTVDGNVIPFNDPNGWAYHQNRKTCQGAKQCIELRGTACDSIQDGNSHQILGDFACTYYDPDNPPISGGDGGGWVGLPGGTGGSGTGGDGGTTSGGGGTGGDGGGTSGGGSTGGGSTQCRAASSSCDYDGDCCSGICSATTNGICVVN